MLDLRTPPAAGRNGLGVSDDSSDFAKELVELSADDSTLITGTPRIRSE